MRLSGKIVRFDGVRGYGFITPDDGGDDVFLHANDLEMEKSTAQPGTRVSFDVEVGERGQFATSVRRSNAESPVETVGRGASFDGEFDDYIDVLSVTEFEQAVTELLLAVSPPLNAPQILSVRATFGHLARQRGWLDSPEDPRADG